MRCFLSLSETLPSLWDLQGLLNYSQYSYFYRNISKETSWCQGSTKGKEKEDAYTAIFITWNSQSFINKKIAFNNLNKLEQLHFFFYYGLLV